MTSNEMNPDAPILEQLRAEWQKMLIAVLWICKGTDELIISNKDLQALIDAFPVGGPVLLTIGFPDGVKVKLVTLEKAREIEAFQATQKGHA